MPREPVKIIRWAKISVSDNPAYRYTIEDNPDIPGCVNISYEEWDDGTRKWKPLSSHTFECVSVEILQEVADVARTVCSLCDEDKS